jgi:hypothetical protein
LVCAKQPKIAQNALGRAKENVDEMKEYAGQQLLCCSNILRKLKKNLANLKFQKKNKHDI